MNTNLVHLALARPAPASPPGSRRSADAILILLLAGVPMNFSQGLRAQETTNTPPTISAIPDQMTAEDIPLIGIPFTVWDPETPPDQLRFSTQLFIEGGPRGSSSFVVGGFGTNRWFSIVPPRDQSGAAWAHISVQDANGAAATTRFRVEIRPVNDPPWLPATLPDQVGLRGQGSLPVTFPVFDRDTAVPFRLRAWSTRQAVVEDSALQFSSSPGSTNRMLRIGLPPQGISGSTAITVEADDTFKTNRVSFILNVIEPEFSRVTNSIPVNTAFQPVWGDFNGDGLLDVVVSPTLILTNQGSGVLVPGITLPGETYSPSGAAADFDGDGHLDLLLFGGRLQLLRNTGGDLPGFSEVALPFQPGSSGSGYWIDLDGDGDLDILPSSLWTNWFRNDGRNGFGNSFVNHPGRPITRVLAAGDIDNDGDADLVVFNNSGLAPQLQLFENVGTGQFTVSRIALPQFTTSHAGWTDVDGDGVLDLWLNQEPTSSNPTNAVIVLRQSPGKLTESFRLSFPPPGPIQSLTNLAWSDFDNDGFPDFTGRFSVLSERGYPLTNYTVIYHNDGRGHFSTTGLAASVHEGLPLSAVADFDNDGSVDLLYRNNSVISLRNQSRVLNTIPGVPSGLRSFVTGNQLALFWNESRDGNQQSPLTYNVRVGTRAGANDLVPSMSTTNGVRMIPSPGNTGFNQWMMVTLPLEQLNTETLFWSVQAVDAGFQGGPFAADQTFTIDPPGNRAPTLTGIGDLSFPEDTSTNLVFFVRDDRTPPESLRIQAISSNPDILPPGGLRLSDFTPTDLGLRVKLDLTPLSQQSGTTVITLTATDRAGLSTSRFLLATVAPVNDPPTLTAPDKILGLAGGSTLTLSIHVSDIETPPEQLVVTARSLTPDVLPDPNLKLTHVSGGDWTLIGIARSNHPALAFIVVEVRDTEGSSASRTVKVNFQRQLFTPYAQLPVSSSVLWADLNGDRRMELLTRSPRSSELAVREIRPESSAVAAQIISQPDSGAVADLGDFDNDGDVDFLVGATVMESGTWRTGLFVYRNLGGYQFERMTNITLEPGVARLADFDLDGRLDVLVFYNSTNLTVYRNHGSGLDAAQAYPLDSNLPNGSMIGNVILADLDSDGRDELVISTDYGSQRIFRWTGDHFARISQQWTLMSVEAVADFNHDQLPELVTDLPTASAVTIIHPNQGALNFNPDPTYLSTIGITRAEVVDFDGDGSSDVLTHGYYSASLHLGDPALSFVSVELPFAPSEIASVVPADFDNDGTMELAVGRTVYRSGSQHTNLPPVCPTNLRVQANGPDSVLLTWDLSNDPNQPGGLTYNVRVGTMAGLGDVMSPLSLADGFRLAPRFGNVGWSTNRVLTGLTPGRTYRWTVQAVDNSFAGGPFAPEVSFAMPGALLLPFRIGPDQFELELRAEPESTWQLEVSSDLKNWSDHPSTDAVTRIGTNGWSRIPIEISGDFRFFRARPR